MRILIKTGLALLALATLLVGLSYNFLRAQDFGTPRNAASRALTTEVRAVNADISEVKIDGPIDLSLRYGATPSLTVQGEQRALPNLVTTLDGKSLTISTKGLFVNMRHPLRAELVLPTLSQLQIGGSGDGKVMGFSGNGLQLLVLGSGDLIFDGRYRDVSGVSSGSGNLQFFGGEMESVDIKMQGSGDVSAKGTAKRLQVRIQGSGDFDASQLKTEQVSVSLIGSGDAEVFAKNAVTVEITGSGDVSVNGNPSTRSIRRQGSGDISFQ